MELVLDDAQWRSFVTGLVFKYGEFRNVSLIRIYDHNQTLIKAETEENDC